MDKEKDEIATSNICDLPCRSNKRNNLGHSDSKLRYFKNVTFQRYLQVSAQSSYNVTQKVLRHTINISLFFHLDFWPGMRFSKDLKTSRTRKLFGALFG